MAAVRRAAKAGAKAIQSEYSEAELSPGFLLWKASNLLLRLQAAALRPRHMTPAQSGLLASTVYLSSSKPQLLQADIIRHTGLDKMFVSDMMRTLAKKGFIRIALYKEDARARRIVATAAGKKAVGPAIEAVESADRRFFARLTNGVRFIKDLQKLLDA